MNLRPYGILLIMTVAVMIGLTSCAPSEVKKEINIVWPPEPEEPKIKYLDMWASNLDVETPDKGVATALFGEEKVSNLIGPYGVKTDKDGRVFATTAGPVFVFDAKNRKFRMIGAEPGLGQLSGPADTAISGIDGKVYVSDIGTKRILVYDRDGRYLTAFGHKGDLLNPIGLAIDDNRQRLYVVDSKKHAVVVFGLDGTVLRTVGQRGIEKGEFNQPTFISLDSKGNIYVSDMQNCRVQVFDGDWNHIRKVGALGDVIGTFTRPKGIALDSEDNLYVVDAAFQNVQIFNNQGQLLLAFGGGGNRPGQFSLPAGIAIDSDDKIYVAEQFTGRIQIFQYMSEKWKKRQETSGGTKDKN